MKLVNIRLKPVKKPIRRTTVLGPYLSNNQPVMKAATPARTILIDTIVDVVVRDMLNVLSMDLKKTPNDWTVP